MRTTAVFAMTAMGAFGAAPDATLTVGNATYTWGEDKTYDGDSIIFWKGDAGNSMKDCANRCESTVNCIGFNFQYEAIDSYKLGHCDGYTLKADGNGVMARPSYLAGKKNGFYERDATVTSPAAWKSFVDPDNADITTEILSGVEALGYVVWDHLYCQNRESGDGAMKNDKMQIGSNTKPGVLNCLKLCEALVDCQAVSLPYAGNYAGSCIAYGGQTKDGNAFGCDLGTGKEQDAIFLRLNGKVTVAECAPDGTDNKNFKICGSGLHDSGAASTAVSATTALLALLAVYLP